MCTYATSGRGKSAPNNRLHAGARRQSRRGVNDARGLTWWQAVAATKGGAVAAAVTAIAAAAKLLVCMLAEDGQKLLCVAAL
jgi:hypothetical protein